MPAAAVAGVDRNAKVNAAAPNVQRTGPGKGSAFVLTARAAGSGVVLFRRQRSAGGFGKITRMPAPAPTTTALRRNAPLPALWLAVALSMGAAVSLGITRFAYALLLPPMREDLGWTYTLAGAMNTVNALG